MCTEHWFTCGVGVTTINGDDEDDMCIENQNVENILPNATTCFCDAQAKEMCHPSGSSSLQMSILALSTALAFILKL